MYLKQAWLITNRENLFPVFIGHSQTDSIDNTLVDPNNSSLALTGPTHSHQ